MTYELNYSDTGRNLKSRDWLWPIIKQLAFSFDAEHMHELAIFLLRLKSKFLCHLDKKSIAHDTVFASKFMGLYFPNPVGLAAGFDVDAECLPALQQLGFGFIEVGGITEHAQPGNKKPRIFRLPEDRAIINRLNFYNKGVYRLRKRLVFLKEKNHIFIPIGVNLGKSNYSSLEDVPKEYLRTFKQIFDVADYITINVSCPNTEGLVAYQTTQSLSSLLDAVCNFNETLSKKVPLLLKLGPDLTNEEAIACAEIALDYGLAGLIISNTTTKRTDLLTGIDFGPGGLSGQPLFEKSTQLLRCIAKDYGKKLVLIGSGGIMEGSQALAKLNAGANLLQVYTGFIYGGPRFIIRLLHYLQVNHQRND
jgi:dihydroorotate dehydrogenase